MHAIGKLGGMIWLQWDELRHAAAVVGTALFLMVLPRFRTRTLRNLHARQVMRVGLEPIGFICAVAGLAGIAVVVQLAFWTGEAGQSQLLGPLLVAVVARELGPVLINLIVIIRSGSAMVSELGVLKVTGGVRELEAKGNDPFVHLVMPRVLAMPVSTCCLTVVFIVVTFFSGYVFAAWMGKGSRDFLLFADTVSRAIQPDDVLNLLAKSILPALFAGASCCIGGLSVSGGVEEIPRATQRALSRSVVGLFVISSVVSLLTYL